MTHASIIFPSPANRDDSRYEKNRLRFQIVAAMIVANDEQGGLKTRDLSENWSNRISRKCGSEVTWSEISVSKLISCPFHSFLLDLFQVWKVEF
jgi:hypothetical protein